MYSKDLGKIVLKEAGPRFEMQPYEIRLGTLDQNEAEKEWVLRPYMNTARKRQAL
jgi:U3 small nucleolar ribonucleoprotein protein IMP4